MYHRVTDDTGDRLAVSPSAFRRQMEILASGRYRVMSLAEILSADNSPGTSPAVVITFDDGYQDFYNIVFPILRERSIPAAIFVVPDFIDGKINLPRYRNLKGAAGSVSWEMLREMKEDGITVGAHSVTHRELIGLDCCEMEREINGSADIIEKQLGQRPEWFSYPRGKYSPSLSRLVEAGGYKGAVTVRPGTNRVPCDYFTLRRTEISREDDLRDFKLKLAGAYDLPHHLWQKVMGNRL